MVVTKIASIQRHEVSIAATGTAILKKGDGLGGKTTSLNMPRMKPPANLARRPNRVVGTRDFFILFSDRQ